MLILHKPMSEAVDDPCMWKESRTSGFFSKSGLGACLLIIHRGKEEKIEKEKTIEFTCCQHMRQHINVNLFTVTKIITCRCTETAYKISRDFPAASLDIIEMPIKGGTFPPDLYGVRS